MANMAGTDDPPESIVFLENRSYSHVVFKDVKKSYAPGVDLTCKYSLSEHIVQKPKDWLGIFKVGWTTPRDYFTFVWAPANNTNQSAQQEVFFKAYYLPKDEDEYYQFCYVDQGGAVRGASSPFRFHLEMEDDIVMVTSLGDLEAPQEQNNTILKENQELKETYELLMKEHTDTQALLKNTQEMVNPLMEEKAVLKSQNEDLESQNTELQSQNKALQSQNTDLQSQNKTLQSQYIDLQSQNTELQSQNKALQSQITDLQSQKENVIPASQLRAVEAELVAAKNEIDLLSNQKKELQNQAESWANREQELDMKIKALKEEEAAVSAKFKESETKRKQLRDQNNKVMAEKNLVENNLRAALDRIDLLQTEKTDLKRGFEQMHNDSEAKTKQVNDLALERDHMQQTITKQNVRVQELEKQQQERQGFENAKTVAQQQQKKITDLEHLVKMQEMERDELVVEINDLEHLVKMREMERDELVVEINKMKRGRSTSGPQTSSPARSIDEQWETLPGSSGLIFGNPYGSGQPSVVEKTCPLCQNVFSEDLFDAHYQLEHTLKCPECSMTCDELERQVFEDHMLCHSMEY